MTKNYTVRYAELPARSIYNHLQPTDSAIQQRNAVTQFYEKLETSIRNHGIQNPINILCGGPADWLRLKTLPNHMKENPQRALICWSIGGSRLMIAQKLDLVVPCLIADYTDQFTDCPCVESENDAYSYFAVRPKKIRFNRTGVWIKDLPHVHLGQTQWHQRTENC